MKKILITALFALAGMATIPSSTQAQELVLGFRNGLGSSPSPQLLEVDLGNANAYVPGANFNLTFGSYSGPTGGNASPASQGLSLSDLQSVFTSFPSSSITFGIGALFSNGGTSAFWITQAGTPHAPVSAGTISGGALNQLGGFSNGFGAGDNSNSGGYSLVSGDSGVYDADNSNPGDYLGAVRFGGASATTDYGFFTLGSTEKSVPTTGSVSLELYKYGNNTVTDQGTFTLTSGGALTFTGATVPEPATMSALLGGAGLLGLLRRRRSVA